MQIEPMGPADRGAVEDLCRRSFSRLYAYFALRALPHAWVFVAKEDGAVVGFVEVISILSGRLAGVYYIAVEPASRGKGVGMALLEAALTWARGVGFLHAMASVPRRNVASLRLFEGRGFRAMGFRSLSRTLGAVSALRLYNEAAVAPHERVFLLDLRSGPKTS